MRKGVFAFPVFPDPDKTASARTIHLLALFAGFLFIIPIVQGAVLHYWLSAALLATLEFLLLGTLILNRAGRTQTAAALMIVGILVFITADVAIADYGVRDIAILVYPALIVCNALLFDRRLFLVMTGLCILAVNGLYIAQIAGVIGTHGGIVTAPRHLLDADAILAVVALTVGMLAQNLRQSLRKTRASEERFRVTIEQAVDAILIGDHEGNIMDANNRAFELTGYAKEELLGIPLKRLFTSQEINAKPLRFDLLKLGQTVTTTRMLSRKNGSLIHVEMNSKMMPDKSYQSFIRDITHTVRMEEEIRKHQHLESLGLLAGGIGHDFNNYLSGISNYIELARTTAQAQTIPVKSSEYLDKALSVLERTRHLALQLLSFSKGGSPVKKLLSISALIRDTVSFSLTGSKLDCRMSIPDTLWPCEMDVGQIGQVLNNLIVNAIQAMPNGGALEVVAENTEIPADSETLLKPGHYVKVSFRDTGVGIPPENLTRIFEPFFTTKESGTGLGLSISYSILKKHGGLLDVVSKLGQGSCFTLYLPSSG